MNVCRICLCAESEAFDRTLMDIFEPNDETQKFSVSLAFRTICGIELSESDPHPNRVCLECRSRLEEAFNLRRLALRSHETLTNVGVSQEPAPAPELLPAEEGDDSMEEQWLEDEPLVQDEQQQQEEQDNDETGDLRCFEEEIVVELDEDQLLVCCGCEFACLDEDELMKHSEKEHFPVGRQVDAGTASLCRMCYAVFSSQQVLEIHWSGKKRGRVIRICPKCQERFGSKTEYEGHKCLDVNDLYRCCGCDFQTKDDKKFRKHVNGHRITEARNRKEEMLKSHPILCSVCSGRFQTEEEHSMHRAGHDLVSKEKAKKAVDLDSDEFTLSCCGCLKVFKTVEELQDHQKQVHEAEREEADRDNPFECQKCFKRFTYMSSLKRHTNSRRCYFCSKCPAVRHSVQDMLQHLASHDGPKSYFCCGCRLHRARFDTVEELQQHSREFHAKRPKFYRNVDNIEEKRSFECQTCFRRYTDEMNLRKHMMMTYQEENFVCDKCGKAFTKLKAFNIHKATHIETFDYACEVCSKKFKQEQGAYDCKLRHIRDAREQYICKICGGKFANSSNLNSHMISHSTVQRYSCSICDMKFKRKAGLNHHMNVVHKGERIVTCPSCPSSFNSSSALEKHLIKHTGVYPYHCEFPGCDKKFFVRIKFIEHSETHAGESELVFPCPSCDQRFSRDHFLSHHLKHAHQIEPQDKEWNKKFNRRKQPAVLGKRKADIAEDAELELVGEVSNEELLEAIEFMVQYDDLQLLHGVM